MKTKRTITTKATHSGRCQICGSFQKLPANVLSKHGYTKHWGFFSGTCSGSGYLPFELSCDRVASVVAMVKSQVGQLHGTIARIKADTSNTAPYLKYDRYSQKSETTATVTLEDGGVVMTLADGSRVSGSRYGYFKVDRALSSLRNSRIGRIEFTITERQKYIQWQEERLAGWKPEPNKLEPVSMDAYLEKLNREAGL